MSLPLILVNCWRRELPTFLGERTLLDTLDPAYTECVSDAGGQPLLVSRPPGASADSVKQLIEVADGLLLTGGGDVDPATYDAARENAYDDDARADGFELALLRAAWAARLPTLAVCRGAELLAVAYGGRLVQRPTATPSHAELAGLSAEQILGVRHPVALAAGSRVRRALGADTLSVNTIHHHQIGDAGELAVTARAPDGAIEAVEPRDGWACLGVQWHPEKMHEPEQRGLFEHLVADARAGAASRRRAA